MSWNGSSSAGRVRTRIAVAALTLAPALTAVFGVPAQVALAVPGNIDVAIDLDGATVDADGVLDLTVTLTNKLGSPASVAVSADDGFACNALLTDSTSYACTGKQFAPTKLGVTTRDATVVTRADWGALGLPEVDDVTYGEHHGCALDEDGQAWCWGVNTFGQLGNNTTTAQRSAAPVAGSHAFTSISAGQHHTCAIDTGHAAWCWGRGLSGRLGNGASGNSSIPVRVSGGLSFASITAADAHTCALSMAGQAWCWGANDSSIGQLGRTPYSPSLTPLQLLPGARTFASISSGGSSTCGVVASDETVPAGAVLCWGSGYATAPERIGFDTWSAVDVGADHACALALADGTAWCWGQNASGQLGRGDTLASPTTPAKVDSATTYDAISAGDRYTCALAAESLSCWGESDGYRLGVDGGDVLSPAALPGTWTGVATTSSGGGGAGTTCGVRADRVACWGVATNGELGDGPLNTPSPAATPVALAGTTTQVHDFDLTVPGGVAVSLTTAIDGAAADSAPGHGPSPANRSSVRTRSPTPET